jgi:hypothetical protein
MCIMKTNAFDINLLVSAEHVCNNLRTSILIVKQSYLHCSQNIFTIIFSHPDFGNTKYLEKSVPSEMMKTEVKYRVTFNRWHTALAFDIYKILVGTKTSMVL